MVGRDKNTSRGARVKDHQKKKGVEKNTEQELIGNNRKERLEVMTEPGVKGSRHKVGVGGSLPGPGSRAGVMGKAPLKVPREQLESQEREGPGSLGERSPQSGVKVH